MLFKYGELVDRATAYKRAISGTADDHNVTVDFAVYKLALYVWACVDPSLSSYGTVAGHSSGCGSKSAANTKLIYKMVQAAREGVFVRVIYHNPDGVKRSPYYDVIWDYLSNTVSSLPDTFEVHRADWEKGDTSGQMHNKFMLVSHLDKATSHATFVTTANVDYFGNDKYEKRAPSSNPTFPKAGYAQSGILVSNETGLFDAYRRYFEIVWDHTLPASQVGGVQACNGPERCRLHLYKDAMIANADINYVSPDGKVQAFFYPVPGQIWNASTNAVAKVTEQMRNDDVNPSRYLKIGMYHLKNGSFVTALADRLLGMQRNLHLRVVYKKDSSGGTLKQFTQGLEKEPGDSQIRSVNHC